MSKLERGRALCSRASRGLRLFDLNYKQLRLAVQPAPMAVLPRDVQRAVASVNAQRQEIAAVHAHACPLFPVRIGIDKLAWISKRGLTQFTMRRG